MKARNFANVHGGSSNAFLTEEHEVVVTLPMVIDLGKDSSRETEFRSVRSQTEFEAVPGFE
jgi:hypothetical protein